MLILTRRVGETLRIGDDVSVTILGIKGNQVRVGIDAPKEVSVHREEIYQRIQNEKGIDIDDEDTTPEPEPEPIITTPTYKPAKIPYNPKTPKITKNNAEKNEANGNK